MLSLHVAFVGLAVGTAVSHRSVKIPQEWLEQSKLFRHTLPKAHRTEQSPPPQSIEVSFPFRIPSLHVATVGTGVGLSVGLLVGLCVGDIDGDPVGKKVGLCVGLALGLSVGLRVGDTDGAAVGLEVSQL